MNQTLLESSSASITAQHQTLCVRVVCPSMSRWAKDPAIVRAVSRHLHPGCNTGSSSTGVRMCEARGCSGPGRYFSPLAQSMVKCHTIIVLLINKLFIMNTNNIRTCWIYNLCGSIPIYKNRITDIDPIYKSIDRHRDQYR